MLSRSHILIEKELLNLTHQSLWGIEVSLINDNLYEWSARICGPLESPYEGGVFRVYLKFDEHYNVRPPKICFHTIPYHPNIDMITGRPCVDYLDDSSKWSKSISIGSILVQIQNLLKNPVLESPVNTEAADMLKNSPEAYKKVARECVNFSKLIDAGEEASDLENRQVSLQRTSNAIDTTTKVDAGEKELKKEKKTTKLSFDNYFMQWSGLATTKPLPTSINTYLESIKGDDWLSRMHYGMSDSELEDDKVNKQIEYGNLYYGVLNQKDKEKVRPSSTSKLARINHMRKIYLPKKPLPTPRSPTRHSDSDNEGDNLIAWTQGLNPDDLDEF